MQAPCKDCPEREPGCHSKCQKYADYKAYKADVAHKRYLASIAPEGAKRGMWRKIRREHNKG